jgi:hypothetical protein
MKHTQTIITDHTRVALVSEDLIKGFCCEGALAITRAASIVPAAVDLFQCAHDLGVRHCRRGARPGAGRMGGHGQNRPHPLRQSRPGAGGLVAAVVPCLPLHPIRCTIPLARRSKAHADRDYLVCSRLW